MKYKVNRCKFLIGPSIKSTDKRAKERPFEILNSYLYLVHPLFFNHTIIPSDWQMSTDNPNDTGRYLLLL